MGKRSPGSSHSNMGKKRKGLSQSPVRTSPIKSQNMFEGFPSEDDIPQHVKFVYISLNDSEENIKKYNFILYKTITNVCDNIISANYISGNRLLVELPNKNEVKKVMKIKNLVGYSTTIKVEPALKLGTSIGIIYAPDLLHEDEKEIGEWFKNINNNVLEVKRLNKGPEKIKTPLLKLTFGAAQLPNNIKLGFMSYNIEPYYPPPLRCFNCKKYGHSTITCRNSTVCGRCGGDHNDSECANTNYRCTNCGQNHTTYDKTCESYLNQKNIVKIKVDRNISFKEAKTIYYNSKSYSNVASNNIDKNLSEAQNLQQLETLLQKILNKLNNNLPISNNTVEAINNFIANQKVKALNRVTDTPI